ncbi:MAG TPA: ubiquinol-cytochrome C chaperone family protein [Stellaceae bacterium]|jgi:cytochrome b pre-mRNA-processing protein 3|nr:ubiquinol-cytochrome C chaperone family protein [Stellaceae bacterium]
MLNLFKTNPVRDAAEAAYRQIVDQARRPEFFAELGVPDTLDGRFELICLHAFLYLQRLKSEPEGTALGQRFFDTMFIDFDRSLREMGTGDLSVGRHVKRMVEAFYGRVAAYEFGLVGADEVLHAALARNLFGTAPPPAGALEAMATYLRREAAQLTRQPANGLLAGKVSFGPPPTLVRPLSTDKL